ncbi:SURF1 family protein [uncultured Microbacterium sp.]|uniref:SURF1 family cytochrome oxidase biogenesis protein n=1 Tax=uncultured Microbacterium sp. TaxID=191216 RepID=UPI0035CB1A91
MSRATAPAAVRWTIYVAVAIVFAIACAFLSNWQFSRNAERSEQLTLIAANYDREPVSLDTAIPSGATLNPLDEWLPVVLTGRYLSDEQLLARNRPHSGTAAFEVLVPFQADDGRVLLVDRGWVPPGNHQPDPDVIPAAPAGDVTVIVRLRPGEALPASGRSAPDGQVPTINLAFVAELLDPTSAAALEQSAYGLMVSESPAPPTRPQAVDAPSADPGPYLSYAIQWILFAIMGFVFIWYVIRSERRARREDAEDRAAVAAGVEPPTRAPVKRRRDRDAEDEDALLDSTR